MIAESACRSYFGASRIPRIYGGLKAEGQRRCFGSPHRLDGLDEDQVSITIAEMALSTHIALSLTRFCRNKFERDDLLEAQILCGTKTPDEVPSMPDDQSFNNQEVTAEKGDPSPDRRSRVDRWTWKLSTRVGMSYRTVIHHQRNNIRQPNPFSRGSADSSIPLEPCASTAGLLAKEPLGTDGSMAALNNQTIHESPVEEHAELPEDTKPTLVVSHPPHPVWDDDSNPDTPYENPYYTRPINDILWLPRDPLGILNLDDTVDVRMALTSDPGAGKLGAWQEDEFLCSAIESAFATSFGSVDADSLSVQYSPQPEGSEVLAPPPSVMSRSASQQRPHSADATLRRPSLLSPPRPSHVSRDSDRSSSPRRPMPLKDRPSTAGFRSFSLGADSMASTARPTSSHLSVPSVRHHRQRSVSVDALSVGPISASPSQLSGSVGLRSMIRMPSTRLPSGSTSPGAASIISTREVVVSEAIAEEQVAAQQRQRQDVDDEERAKEPRSWLTSWIYSKGG